MFSYIYYLDWENIKYRNSHFLSYFSSYMRLPLHKHGIIVGDLNWPWSWPILHSLLSLFFFFFLCFTISLWCRRFWNFFLLGCLGFFRRRLWLNTVIWVLKDGFVMSGKGKERDFVFCFVFLKIVSVLHWYKIDVGQSRGK